MMDSPKKSRDLLIRLKEGNLTFKGKKGEFVVTNWSSPGSKEQADVQIIKSIGSGGQGYVYNAWDFKLGKKMCVKMARETQNVSFDRATKGIQREIDCLKKLSEASAHASIVSMHDYGESDHGPFICLERCRGSDLWALWKHYQNKRSGIPSAALHKIMWDAASALKHCSEVGILHCDLSPGNFVWYPSMCRGVKLIDFGYAVVIDEAKQFLGGTTGFLPPEQLLGSEPHLMSDVFGLGCMFFTLRAMKRLEWNYDAGVRYFAREKLSGESTNFQTKHEQELTVLNTMKEGRLLRGMLDFDASKRPKWVSVLDQIKSITTGVDSTRIDAVLSEDAVEATKDSGSQPGAVQSVGVTTANLDQPAENSSSSGPASQSVDDDKDQQPASAENYEDCLDSPEEQKFEEENYPETRASIGRHRQEQIQKTADNLEELENAVGFKNSPSQKASELKSDIAKMKRSTTAQHKTKEVATKIMRKSILELGEKAKKEMREQFQQSVEREMSKFASEINDIVNSEYEAVE